MEEENVQAQEEVVEQEEQTSEEIDSTEETQEENITLTKAEFTRMQRKAMAYDANKSKKPNYKPSSKEPAVDDEIIRTVKNLDLMEKKRQFGYENELSPEETDFVFKITGGKPTKEILKDPFVKNGIDGFRQSKRIADNTPGSTSRSPVFGTKNFAEMTDDERKAQFNEASKKFKK